MAKPPQETELEQQRLKLLSTNSGTPEGSNNAKAAQESRLSSAPKGKLLGPPVIKSKVQPMPVKLGK